MKLVKLDAIDSTNDYLKDLVRTMNAENYTVVTAEHQTKGKGQRGSTWASEKGKNLIMSMLVRDFINSGTAMFDLNIVVSLAVLQALDSLDIPKLSIKWPNDIMSDDKKIGGILIENSFKSDNTVDSIVGIGLNVNQLNFENLTQASSLAVITGSSFDKEHILEKIANAIQDYLKSWPNNGQQLQNTYTNLLFKKEELMVFQASDDSFFNGTIKGITTGGRLVIENDKGTRLDFDIKEVKMIF
ncbi:MAG: biotin--[acetyl-CoA-carboxylase] ligase [Flavobacterium sp.]|nr:biotin--[acetyl-CoA-carboxylase] ligase [Flavobacterium sp.]